MPRIYVLSGADLGRSFDVPEGGTIGRAADGAIVLRDPSVSRAHARLERAHGGWRVVDLGSRNGLFAGETRVEAQELGDGDEFRLGEVLLRFRAEPEARALEATRIEAPPAREPQIPRAPGPRDAPALEFVPGGGAGTAGGAAREGLELEGAWSEPDALAPETRALPGARAVPDARALRMAAAGIGASSSAARPAARERSVLQFQRIEQRDSLWHQEFAEQPLWLRALAILLALTFAAGLAWLAYKGVLLVRDRVAGG